MATLLVAPHLASNPAVRSEQAGSLTEASVRRDRPLRDEARQLLSDSYALSQQFPPADRAFYLFRLASAYATIGQTLPAQQSLEMYRLASSFSPSWNRAALQKNALVVMAEVDPRRAVGLLGDIAQPPFDGNGASFEAPEDLRSDAARPIFERCWTSVGAESLELIVSTAESLGRTGQYPFAAMAPILADLLHARPKAAAAILQAALSTYQHSQQSTARSRKSIPQSQVFNAIS